MECRLKAACFDYFGHGYTETITKMHRDRIVASAKGFGISPVGPHDLSGWSRLLVAFRTLNKPGVDRLLNKSIVEKADSVARFWAPQMRYRATEIPRNHADEVRAAIDWFKRHYAQMIPS